MKGELLPNFSDDTPRWFYELGLRCLSLKPEDRPTALEVAYTIKQPLALSIAIFAYGNALQACTSDLVTLAFSGLNVNTLYCCGALDSTPCLSSAAYSCPKSKSIYKSVQENFTLTLSCDSGYVISNITFASYGKPTDTVEGNCHAKTSLSVMTKNCVSQQTCLVDAINAVFGDPCVGTGKFLNVQATCAASTASALGSECKSACGPNSSDIFRSSVPPFTSSDVACLKNYSSCGNFMASIQSALGKISPACYLQQSSMSSVSTLDAASYMADKFLDFLQSWSGFSSGAANSGSSATLSPTNLVNDTSNDSSSNTTIIIIVVVAVVVVILVALLVFCYCRKKKSKSDEAPAESEPVNYSKMGDANQQTSGNDNIQEELNITNYTPRTKKPLWIEMHGESAIGPTTSTDKSPRTETWPSTKPAPAEPIFSKIKMRDVELHYIPPNHLYEISVIARGAYGIVLLGDYQGQTVAIKKLLEYRKGIRQLQQFIDEVSLVAKLTSPYIVQFKGASWTTPADIVLVTEFMDGGDLRIVLDNNSTKSFTWQNKVSCAMDIANALGYLHTLHTKVIHRDLKSRNVLLNSQMQAKVTDFGVSRETDDATMTAGIGTFRWMAPEVLLDNYYTESADMFSFGVILAELSNEIVPYSDKKNASGRPYTDTAIMTQVMKGELLPNFSDDTPRWFYELGLRCLSLKPEDRPTALQVARVMKGRV
ncbi:kinase [Thraustotheca clavata]|uniref:Kinase n=1 Tax=Thraustotheca clavata TaxID=74557 RepID=A0A1W0AAA8_9STRA|nr:kinase [Thraustotheca clavata]